jgi:hypothetical protein
MSKSYTCRLRKTRRKVATTLRTPHVKIVMLAVFALIVILGTFLLSKSKQRTVVQGTGGIVATSSIDLIKNVSEIDSDKDGLKDWEESLWKSDSQKADSDADGTTDGEEVRLGRNPGVKGPNDKITIQAEGSASNENDPTLTRTDRLSRELFARYLEAKQSGQALDASMQEQLVNTVIENSYLSYKEYTANDLRIINDGSELALRKYANEMGLALATYSTQEENEGVIIRRSVDREDKSEMKKVDRIITSYENILAASLKVEVPQEAVTIHLGVLNAYSDTIMTIKGMRGIYDDPFTAVQAISHYQDASRGLLNAFLEVKGFFAGKRILFEKTEPGYMYTNTV